MRMAIYPAACRLYCGQKLFLEVPWLHRVRITLIRDHPLRDGQNPLFFVLISGQKPNAHKSWGLKPRLDKLDRINALNTINPIKMLVGADDACNAAAQHPGCMEGITRIDVMDP